MEKTEKKIVLSKTDLDKNIEGINEFLMKKSLSAIRGGINAEPDWSHSNYCESTYVRKY
jgi:hypothetical protein